MSKSARIGILTISDRASRGEYQDRGGPAIREWLQKALAGDWEAVPRMVADEQDQVEAVLRQLCDHDDCCLVVTTGGTGPARRDVTPEATVAVCDKMLDGFGELMRRASLRQVDRNPLASGGRHTRWIADHQSAGETERDRRLPRGGVSGCSLLHRPD